MAPLPRTTTSSPILIGVRWILLMTQANGSVNAAISDGVSFGYMYIWLAFTTTYSENPKKPEYPFELK